jgi:hypothetical protein
MLRFNLIALKSPYKKSGYNGTILRSVGPKEYGAAPACVLPDYSFLNFLFLFVSRQKEKRKEIK